MISIPQTVKKLDTVTPFQIPNFTIKKRVNSTNNVKICTTDTKNIRAKNHFFALTVDGLAETRDLGKTWKIITPLPVTGEPLAKYVRNAFVVDFDPVHDFFYIIPQFHGPHSLLAYHWQE